MTASPERPPRPARILRAILIGLACVATFTAWSIHRNRDAMLHPERYPAADDNTNVRPWSPIEGPVTIALGVGGFAAMTGSVVYFGVRARRRRKAGG